MPCSKHWVTEPVSLKIYRRKSPWMGDIIGWRSGDRGQRWLEVRW